MNAVKPDDAQSASELLKHVHQGYLIQVVGWIVAGLASIAVTLLGYIGVKESRKVSILFRWKDDVVDRALKEMPEKYVLRRECDRKHEEILYEVRHTRRLLERHLGVDGSGPSP